MPHNNRDPNRFWRAEEIRWVNRIVRTMSITLDASVAESLDLGGRCREEVILAASSCLGRLVLYAGLTWPGTQSLA